jgi:GntR family transcriptional regulator/MocR family aminotransferase
VTVSAARRLQPFQWADRADAWVVEDDYDSEFRYSSRPLNCLHGVTCDKWLRARGESHKHVAQVDTSTRYLPRST